MDDQKTTYPNDHIPHELALKLKEAGFPQTGQSKKWSQLMSEWQKTDCKPTDGAYIPTLSELIEECNKDSVIVITVGKGRSIALHGKSGFVAEAPTIEESLASLYLVTIKE